jgi:hypothetical protein
MEFALSWKPGDNGSRRAKVAGAGGQSALRSSSTSNFAKSPKAMSRAQEGATCAILSIPGFNGYFPKKIWCWGMVSEIFSCRRALAGTLPDLAITGIQNR